MWNGLIRSKSVCGRFYFGLFMEMDIVMDGVSFFMGVLVLLSMVMMNFCLSLVMVGFLLVVIS